MLSTFSAIASVNLCSADIPDPVGQFESISSFFGSDFGDCLEIKF